MSSSLPYLKGQVSFLPSALAMVVLSPLYAGTEGGDLSHRCRVCYPICLRFLIRSSTSLHRILPPASLAWTTRSSYRPSPSSCAIAVLCNYHSCMQAYKGSNYSDVGCFTSSLHNLNEESRNYITPIVDKRRSLANIYAFDSLKPPSLPLPVTCKVCGIHTLQ